MTKPVDVLKYCPKCGSDRFIAQSNKSFKCEACGFHFFVNSASAVAALIVNDQGELLLTVRGVEPNKGMLDLPGGFVDPGERVEDALRREILEELNLQVDEARFLVSFPNEYVFSGYSVFTSDLGFVCRVSDFSDMHCKDDISGYEFVNLKEIDYQKICSESIRQIVKCFQDYSKK